MKHTYLAAAIAGVLTSSANAADIEYQHLWTFSHTEANGSKSMGSEIVAYDATNYHLWVIGTDANEANVGKGGIDILDLSGQLVHSIETQSLGGINSVAVKNNQAAVSITAPVKTDPGLVRFFDAATFSNLADVTVGANPDAVTYTPNGSLLLVANEGEPSSYLIGPSGDPEGSVSVINVRTHNATTAEFSKFNSMAENLEAKGVRLTGPNATVSQDLEPEYISVDHNGKQALATLLYLNKQPDPVCRLLLAEDAKRDFNGLRQSDTGANHIIVGDIGNAWSYPLLNEVFNCLMQGAKLIAPSTKTGSGRLNTACKWISAGLLRAWNMRPAARP